MEHFGIIKSDVFNNFSCLAEKCKFTCCQKWKIYLSKNDYLKLKNIKTADKETKEKICRYVKRIKNGTDHVNDSTYAELKLREDKYCDFLKDGLCSLQISLGYSALPLICRSFPRMIMGSKTFGIENHLTSACEEAVRLLIDHPDKITVYMEEISNERELPSDYTIYISDEDLLQRPILEYYWDIRVMCINILQNRLLTVDERMLCLAKAMREIDEAERNDDLEEIYNITERFNVSASTDAFSGILEGVEKYNEDMMLLNAKIFFDTRKSYENIAAKIYTNLDMTYEAKINMTDLSTNENMTCSREKYISYTKKMTSFEGFSEYMLENVLINLVLEMMFPFNVNVSYENFTETGLFENYILLAGVYSILKFYLSGYMAGEPTKEKIIEGVMYFSRNFIHSKKSIKNIKDNMKKYGVTNIPQIALLLNS